MNIRVGIARQKRVFVWSCLAVLLFTGVRTVPAYAQSNHHYIRHVRSLEIGGQLASRPVGIAFLPVNNTFQVLAGQESDQSPPQMTDIFQLTLTNDAAGSARISAQIQDPINVAFDPKFSRLLIYVATARHLIEVPADAEGRLDPAGLIRHRVDAIGIENPQGMTIDPASGRLFILDAAGPQVVAVAPTLEGDFAAAETSRLELAMAGPNDLRGLAFDPTTSHLHLVMLEVLQLVEFTVTGEIVGRRDLSELALHNPQALVFAPSGDQTDDPAEMSLYVVDSGRTEPRGWATSADACALTVDEPLTRLHLPLVAVDSAAADEDVMAAQTAAETTGQIVELSLGQTAATQPLAAAASSIETALIQTIDASSWPSPDTSGLSYLQAEDTLLAVDSEVNETALFTGNFFRVSRTGDLRQTESTTAFSDEPTGITVNPKTGQLFFTDDTGISSVYIVDPGPDNEIDPPGDIAPDDTVTSFSTEAFDSHDAEGIAFDPVEKVLYIADGMNNEIYRVAPGPNGTFDGIPPSGDDELTSFDTEVLGLLDPEGITVEADSGHLYIVGNPVTALVHVTLEGALLRALDICAANPRDPAGLVYAPSSAEAGALNVYVADRGVDNDVDPNENDGRVYELSLIKLTPDNQAPVVDAGSDQTITLPDATELDGTLVQDDRVPAPATVTWSQVSGPGSVIFSDTSTADTSATFTLPGVYVLRLTATDGELSGQDKVMVTVLGEAAVEYLDVRIAGTEPDNPNCSSDDAEEIENAASSLDRFGNDLDMLYDRGVGQTIKIVGLRFNGLNIPPGAIITNAYVQFVVDERSIAETTLTIQGQAADNPETFSFDSKIAPRDRTGAQVSWSPPVWMTVGGAGSDQRTPNIAAIVQEIVDRQGWASGNSLVVMISGSGERSAVAFEGDPVAAPLLHVEYRVNEAPVVNAGEDQILTLPNNALLLKGTITDDGLRPLTTMWSQVSGPETVTFSDPSTPETKATFSTAGTYVLRLAAEDGEFSTGDDVTVSVRDPRLATTLNPVAEDYVNEDKPSENKGLDDKLKLKAENDRIGRLAASRKEVDRRSVGAERRIISTLH